MTPQEHDAIVLSKRPGEIAPLLDVPDQHVRARAESRPDVPERDVRSELVGCHEKRPHGNICNSERKHDPRMTVCDSLDILPRRVDGRMDEAFRIRRSGFCAHHPASDISITVFPARPPPVASPQLPPKPRS